MEEKKHFKLFKAGKKWCTMAIATFAVAAGLTALTTTASADTAAPAAGDQPTQTLAQQQSTDKTSPVADQPTTNDHQSSTQTTVDYQTPVNAGSLDGATVTDQGNVEFSGWHATNAYKEGMHHFAIVVDGNDGHELYRHETTTVDRPDVAAVYPHAPIAGQGGFTIDVPTNKLANADSIRIVSRYTLDKEGNLAGGSDYWFPVITTRNGWLDQFQVTGNQITVAGWHVDDQAADKTAHTIILFDKTKNREVARVENVKNVASPDLVKAGYATVANAKNARFTVNFAITPAMMGDEFAVVSRYSRPGNDNDSTADYWFTNTLKLNNQANAGWLDNFSVDKANKQIVVSGWNANDNSLVEPVHEVILFDKTANKEVGTRQIKPTLASPDVAKVYGNVYNAGQSRFTARFDVTPAMLNHQFMIISRYAQKGHDNDAGYYSDYAYNNQALNLNTNKSGYLDTFYIDKANGKAVISGWGADDASMFMPTHFIILFDKTANREIAHQIVTNQASADVKRSAAGNIANAGNCRFSTTFDITPEMVGHQLTVLSRYSDSTKENDYGNYSDYWYNNTADFTVKQQAYLDTFALNAANHMITVAGWHADDATVYMPGHFVILFDKTANHEVAHKLVPVTTSPDVASATHITNAGKARFQTAFDLTPAMLNHTLVVVSRYSNSTADDYGSASSDYWFNNQINLDAQDGWLDNLSQSGNTINVAGWHTADSTLGLTHHVVILYDYTAGKEVSRHEVTNAPSGDLAASHGNFVNANNARFATNFTVDSGIANHTFGIISRYSNQANGEGVYSQYWMNNRYLNAYQNPGWMYQIQYSQIKANPAEVGHNIGVGYEGVKTWFIKSKLGDANIHNQFTSGDAYAIMNIQRSHGLPATGWVDLPTWRALGYSDDLWYGIDSYVSPTLTNPAATRQQRIDAMINTAYHYMGKPWWAGCSSAPSWGVDCSGLVMQALYGAGINPTTVSSTHHGYPGNEWNSRNLFVDPHFQNVSWNERQRGDLVFYYQPGTRTIWHVAILLDPNTVIESWPPSVMVQPILNGQRNVVAGIRRVFA